MQNKKIDFASQKIYCWKRALADKDKNKMVSDTPKALWPMQDGEIVAEGPFPSDYCVPVGGLGPCDAQCFDDACVCCGGTEDNHCSMCRKSLFCAETLNEDGAHFDPNFDAEKFCSLGCVNAHHRRRAVEREVFKKTVIPFPSRGRNR